MDEGRWEGHDDERVEHEPWFVLYDSDIDDERQARLDDLGGRPGYHLHPTAYVASGAHVVASRLAIGKRSYVAAGCVLRGEVEIGAHCSLNVGVSTIGRVTIGNAVRIATGVVLVGENHVHTDTERPIALQGLTSEGVVVEDDVWIGANVTVVDGVTIGAHSVVAAGAVVTRDVEPYSLAAGVPARRIRDRRDPSRRLPSDPLARFDDLVQRQWPDVLARCEANREGVRTYVDVPGAEWGPRPLNDAVEIAGMFDALPPVAPRKELVARIQASQDPVSGLFVDPRVGPPDPAAPLKPTHHEWRMYGLLSCGYALEVLGAGPLHPVHAVASCGPEELGRLLDSLDMGLLAWPSGAWIAGFGTGLHLNRAHHGSTDTAPMLWGWLLTHQEHSGMWGTWLPPDGRHRLGWLMAVNGFYRLTRGTYAQFGVDIPRPEATIDTVLAHCRDADWFRTRERTACNVLDVVHPLWLLGRQTDHRRAEIRSAVGGMIVGIVDDWVDGAGFAFEAGGPPGLQGSEMWTAILHLAAAVVGEADGLSFVPQGVHRLEPASSL
ncbi:MAG: acyltransferase [Actinomycetota bacterium]|nr:acyltransferase [Actinomycetota bacterium]